MGDSTAIASSKVTTDPTSLSLDACKDSCKAQQDQCRAYMFNSVASVCSIINTDESESIKGNGLSSDGNCYIMPPIQKRVEKEEKGICNEKNLNQIADSAILHDAA